MNTSSWKKKTLNKNFVHSTCIGQARALCYKGFFYAFITNVMRIWSFLWILAQCQWLNYYWILTTTEITKPTSIIPFSVEAPVTVTASPSSSPTRILELKVSNFYQSLYPIARIWPSSLIRYFFKKIACTLAILTIWFGCLKLPLNNWFRILSLLTQSNYIFSYFSMESWIRRTS